KPEVLDRSLAQLAEGQQVLVVDRARSVSPRPLAILNSAELASLHPVFKARGFEVVSLIHEFLSRYPAPYRERIWKNSDQLLFPTDFVKDDSIVENREGLPAHTLLQGLINPDFGRMPRYAARQLLESEIGSGASDFIVLSCGTAELRKGIDLFV